jgi:hypothetical protein
VEIHLKNGEVVVATKLLAELEQVMQFDPTPLYSMQFVI